MSERHLATGHLIVSATINGHPTKLLLDSSAPANLLDIKAAADLDLNEPIPSDDEKAIDPGARFLQSHGNILVIGEKEFVASFRVTNLSYLVAAFSEKGVSVSGILSAEYTIRPGAILDLVGGRIDIHTD